MASPTSLRPILMAALACVLLAPDVAQAQSAYLRSTGSTTYFGAHTYPANTKLYHAQGDGDATATTSWSVALPFTFNFHGTDYDTATVSSAGYITFGGPSAISANAVLPSTSAPRPMIAPFWDYLSRRYHGNPSYENAHVYHVTRGSAPNRTFIVSWYRMGTGAFYLFNNASFNVELHERSQTIRFHYGPGYYSTSSASNGTFSATSGLQNADGTDAVCAFTASPPCSNTVTPNNYSAGFYVDFTRNEDHGVESVSGPASAAAGETITVQRTLRNTGGLPMGPRGYRIYLSTDRTITTSDALLFRGTIPALAPGESDATADTFLLDFGGPEGDYYFGVLLDEADAHPGNDALAATSRSSIAVPLTITAPLTLPDAVQALPLPTDTSYQFKAVGPGTTRAWSISGGSLPSGITLNPTSARLEGTPTAPTGEGGQSFTVSVSNGSETASREYNLIVRPRLAITTTALPDGVPSTPYLAQLEAVGGPDGRTWTRISGTLPSGVSLDASTGRISGTLSSGSAGTYSPRFRITAGAQTDEATLPIVVHAKLAVILPGTPTHLPEAIVGQAYAMQPSISGGIAGERTASIAAGNLPPGLSVDPSTGVISGTVSTTGSWTFTYRVVSGTQTVELVRTIDAFQPLVIVDTSLPLAVEGRAYNHALTATGGTASRSWSRGSTPALFAGISFNTSTGVLSGTPSAPAAPNPRAYTFTVTSGSQSANRVLELQVIPRLVLAANTPPAAVRGALYSYALPVSGGVEAKSFTVTGGSLPPGLSLNATTGTVTGTPTMAGAFSCTVRVTSGEAPADQEASQSYAFAVYEPLVITTDALPTGEAGKPYGPEVLTFTGGSGSWSWSASGLPPGLSLHSQTGELTGTPDRFFLGDVTVTLTRGGQTAQRTFRLQIRGVLTILTQSLADAARGGSYVFDLQSDGAPDVTWQLASGSLPQGLSLSPSGRIAGTLAAVASSSTFTVRASGDEQSVARELTLGVYDPLTITITALPDGVAADAYAFDLRAAGGTGTYAWNALELPAGLVVSPGGVLSGTPAPAGTHNVRVRVTSGTLEATAELQLVVHPRLWVATASVPEGRLGVAYEQAIHATGGIESDRRWSVTSGSLPPGLALSAAGQLAGLPVRAGEYTFEVQVDSGSQSATRALSMVVAQASNTLTVTTRRLPPALVGASYELQLEAAGGEPPYEWSSDALPPGFTLTKAGLLAGLGEHEGHHAVTFTVTDKLARSASAMLGLLVADPARLTIVEDPLPAAFADVPYEAQLEAVGGTGPYAWSIASGKLPDGLTLDDDGRIHGVTEEEPEVFRFTAEATDAEGLEASAGFVLAVGRAGEVLLLTSELPGATVGESYQAELIAAGLDPLVFTVAEGLPPTMALAPHGVIAGTATEAGSYTFVVHVEDAAGFTGSRELSILVAPPTMRVDSGCGCAVPGAAGLLPLLALGLLGRRRRHARPGPG